MGLAGVMEIISTDSIYLHTCSAISKDSQSITCAVVSPIKGRNEYISAMFWVT